MIDTVKGALGLFWKRYAKLESRVTELEKRIAKELETTSIRKCPFCGARTYYLLNSAKNPNYTASEDNTYKCSTCSKEKTYTESKHYLKE